LAAARRALPELKTPSTENVGLTADQISLSQFRNLLTRLQDPTRKLVTHNKRRLDPIPDPLMPIIDLHIRATDARRLHPNQDIIQPNRRDRPFLVNRSRPRFELDNTMHLALQTLTDSDRPCNMSTCKNV